MEFDDAGTGDIKELWDSYFIEPVSVATFLPNDSHRKELTRSSKISMGYSIILSHE